MRICVVGAHADSLRRRRRRRPNSRLPSRHPATGRGLRDRSTSSCPANATSPPRARESMRRTRTQGAGDPPPPREEASASLQPVPTSLRTMRPQMHSTIVRAAAHAPATRVKSRVGVRCRQNRATRSRAGRSSPRKPCTEQVRHIEVNIRVFSQIIGTIVSLKVLYCCCNCYIVWITYRGPIRVA